MKYYGRNSLSSFISVILTFVLLFGVMLTGYTFYTTFNNESIDFYKKIIIFIMLIIGIVCTFIIIINLKKVIKTLVNEDPFIIENVKALKKISKSCFVIATCYILNFFISLTEESFKIIYIDSAGVHTNAEIFIFLLAGCFIGILSKVFEKAIKYKEENDLTI
ncbi:MAG: DUF2975 domain-containing protein [Clostridiaceae bacterium]|nr:DUF2975 domain-containing protein [Clostridiaceae bacterium]